MWHNVHSAERLNGKKIFQGVYYTHEVKYNLDNELQERYFDQVNDTLEGLARIKYNPDYCTFVSKKVGFNLFKGFEKLKDSPLVINTYNSDKATEHSITSAWPQLGRYSYELLTANHSLKQRKDTTLSTGFGHEIGHALYNAAYYNQLHLNENFFRTFASGRENHKRNWREERVADKISIAINPSNNIGQFLYENNKEANFNSLYQNGRIGKTEALILSRFVAARDELFTQCRHKEDLNFLNKLFEADISVTHPNDFARAVEADRFASDCRNYLNNRKP